jgi:hypothetical protein
MNCFRRAAAALIASVLALAGLAALPSGATARQAPSPTHLSLRLSSGWVTAGDQVIATARLTDKSTGTPLAGEHVWFQYQETDVVLSIGRMTSATGRASFRFRPSYNTALSVHYDGSSTEAASSNSRAVHVRQVVTIHSPAESHRVIPGHKILVWGIVAPGIFSMVVPPPKQHVVLQWHSRTGWHRLARVPVKNQRLPNGKTRLGYVTHVVPPSLRLRTVSPASGQNERGVSRTLQLAGFTG